MASADRLLVFMEGTLCASGPIFGDFNDRQTGPKQDMETLATLRQIRLCDLSDNIRVAVVAVEGVTIVDVGEHTMQLRHRRVFVENRPCGSTVGRSEPSLLSPRTKSVPGSPGSSWVSMWDAPAGSHDLRETVDAQFVSFSSLAIIFRDEALVIEMNTKGARVNWRVWGSYSKLAVCRTNMHLAFALHSSAVEVFPLKVMTCQHPHSSLPMECGANMTFSPTKDQSLVGIQFSTRDEFARRGVSTRLGIYKVTAIEWHRVPSHTLLCVTCQHPHNNQISVALFTVKSIPMGCLPLQEQGCSAANMMCQWGSDPSLQLIPAGMISLGSMSSSPLAAHRIPNLSRSHDTTSLSNKLEFLCLEMNGTISTTCYRLDQNTRGALFKRQNPGLVAPELLRPLKESYGDIIRIDVLPIWPSRAIEFGTITPQVKQLLGVRRYRLLLHFLNGMVAKVVIDPVVARVRVEAFLTLGVDPLPSHLVTGHAADGGEVLLLGLSRERVFVVEYRGRPPGISEATVMAVVPVPIEHRHLLEDSPRRITASGDKNRLAVAGRERENEDEQGVSLSETRCEEKIRMTACNDDAMRLPAPLAPRCDFIGKKSPVPRCSDGNNSCGDEVVGTEAELASLCFSGAELRVQELHTNAEGICFSTRFCVGDGERRGRRRWWCIPFPALDSFAAAQSDVLICAARDPATNLLRLLNAAPACRRSEKLKEGIFCEWSETASCITVWAPTLPEDPPLSFRPFDVSSPYRFTRVEAVQLTNNDIVVGVMGATRDMEPKKTVLLLYGLDLLRDVAAPPTFVLELEVFEVISFVLCCTADVFLLQRHQKFIEHRTRVADAGESGYHWVEGHTRHKMLCRGEITTIAPLWVDESSRNGIGSGEVRERVPRLSQLMFTSSDGAFIHFWDVSPFLKLETSAQFLSDDASAAVGVGLYHPTAVLLLLGMGRSKALQAVLERIVELAREAAAGHVHVTGGAESHAVARGLCRNPLSTRLYERPSVSLEDVSALPETTSPGAVICTAPLILDAELDQMLRQDEWAKDTASFGANVPLELLDQIIELLPTMQLKGLSTQEQLKLLCVVDAMRVSKSLGVSMDASASRFFFLHKLHQLQRRLRVGGMSVDDLANMHTAFFWASLSDTQPQLLEALFGSHGEKSTLSWGELEVSGVPFWLHSLQALRGLAERVGRGQYHATKDVRESALMYTLAKKTGVLAALCKTEQNAKLHAFFSRNFNDVKNRTAASNNAFAAVSKNQVLYGAAFFVLAGEARSAAQVVLQRHGSPALAFFVLRLAGQDNPEDILWFIEQRRNEEGLYGSLGVWEHICLLWRCGRAQEMLPLLLTRRMPLRVVDAMERLALLRFEGRRTRTKKLNPLRELVLLLRVGRLLRAAGLQLLVPLCFPDAEELLAQLRGACTNEPQTETRRVGGRTSTHMEADFNTGTLTFRGFDMDEDDNDDDNDDNTCAEVYIKTEKQLGEDGGVSVSSENVASFAAQDAVAGVAEGTLLDTNTAVALGRELECMRRRVHDKSHPETSTFRGYNDCLHAVLISTARMIAAFNRRPTFDHAEHHVACLIEIVRRVQKDHHVECSAAPLVDVVGRLVTIAVRLVLISVATENVDYALANALLGCPALADVLREQKAKEVTLATVASYVQIVFDILGRVRAMTTGHLQHGETVEGEEAPWFLYSSFISHDSGHHWKKQYNDGQQQEQQQQRQQQQQQQVHEEKLCTLLFVWFSAFLQLHSLSELREEVCRMQAAVMGLSRPPPPPYAHLLVWLLGCMLCRVTIGLNTVAEQLIDCVVAVQGLDDRFRTDPNGIFIEEEQELNRMAELFERNILLLAAADADADADATATASSSSGSSGGGGGGGGGFCEENAVSELSLQLVSLDLCVAHAELFWELPLANVKISSDTDAVLLHLVDATRTHPAAHSLFCQLSDGATMTLRRMEALWMRRHHTHSSYRQWLLEQNLRGSLTQLVTTDRLVLQRSCHAICSVDYDHSTFDSLVWGTDAGTEVSHGYRDILANDNRAAILREQSEGNIATANFSIGEVVGTKVEAGRGAAVAGPTGEGEGAFTTNRKALMQRPRLSIAAHARVASHPHLPFFLIPHTDGCVDMYSFASTECVATFACRDSYAVTKVAYSPDGYMFAVGLADGSVSCWRFGLGGTSASEPLFVHRPFPPGGVKVTFFSGSTSSLLIVLGLDCIPEKALEGPRGGGAARTDKAMPRCGHSDSHDRSITGTILVIDLVIHGRMVARQKLPFVPEYAVNLEGLESVLCVSVDGRIALYQLLTSSLHIVAPTPLTSPRVIISCVSVSRYDDLVALGTEDGHVLLLEFRTILEAATTCVMEPDGIHSAATGIAEENILQKASRLQLVPTPTSHAGVRCIVFTPSVLLAGLSDGKLVAATLVSNTLRQTNLL